MHCQFEKTDNPNVLYCPVCDREWKTTTPNGRNIRRCEKESEKPSMIQKAMTYASTQVSHTLSGRPGCTQEQIEERYAICKACPFFSNDKCTKCGCHCNQKNNSWLNKLAMADEKCPLDEPKWDKLV